MAKMELNGVQEHCTLYQGKLQNHLQIGTKSSQGCGTKVLTIFSRTCFVCGLKLPVDDNKVHIHSLQ